MSSYAKILSVLKKGGQSADDFPAIRALLKKEQSRELKYGTNNPTIDMYPDIAMEMKRVRELNSPDDTSYIQSLFRLNNPASKRPGNKDVSLNHIMKKDGSESLDSIHTSEDASDSLAERLITRLDEQPIFWADDVADAAKAAPKRSAIEDALIRERERERIFNTNDPLVQPKEYGFLNKAESPSTATRFSSGKDTPSGNPTFELSQLRAAPSGYDTYDPSTYKLWDNMENALEEQMQGRRFFFLANPKIKEEPYKKLVGVMERGKPQLTPYTRFGSGEPSGSFLPNDISALFNPLDARKVRQIFFADGSTI
jgi:hypothetical protein